jgi:sporulation protein YlmC with PRC-barrel domain
MNKLFLSVLFALSLNWTLSASALALIQEEIVGELIGAPVYSTDGQEVGTVAAIELDEDQQFDTLLMKTSRNLGFGERTVRLPGSAFIALRGSVVLDLPAQSMDALIEHGAEEPLPSER